MITEIIRFTGCGSEMQGVGRLSDGRAVFVPFAIPGETAEAEIVQSRDRYAVGKLLRVIDASPDRVAPKCPYYGKCGGCQTQHIAYERALALKTQKVADALTRLGGLQNPDVRPAVPAPEPFGYRNKAEFAFSSDAAGVYEGASHRVIDVDACPLQTDAANAVMRFVRRNRKGLPLRYLVTRGNDAGEMMATISFSAPVDASGLAKAIADEFPFIKSVYACRLAPHPAHALDGTCALLSGKETISETIGGLAFSVSPRSFFQINRAQAENLYRIALDLAEIAPDDRVADVYCGAGTISLAAARRGAFVTGVEIVPEAVRDANANAERNKLSHKSRFIVGDAAARYPALQKSERFSCVIVDPPRKGLDEPVTNALIAAPAKRLVYVSCNPATLARDVKRLTESGAYRFVCAQPVDMFPQTEHVETVCLLIHNRK